jgi:hypothetical protein
MYSILDRITISKQAKHKPDSLVYKNNKQKINIFR